jgi:hypothetical protein
MVSPVLVVGVASVDSGAAGCPVGVSDTAGCPVGVSVVVRSAIVQLLYLLIIFCSRLFGRRGGYMMLGITATLTRRSSFINNKIRFLIQYQFIHSIPSLHIHSMDITDIH